MAPDGKLYWTHYSETSGNEPVSHKLAGHWNELEGKLSWRVQKEDSLIIYVKNIQGVYVEQYGTYYVPVELMPVRMKDGSPFLE